MAEVKTEEKKDWLTPVAITLGVAGTGAGLYFWMKKPPKEVKEGEWGKAGVILSRQVFKVDISSETVTGWKPANIELSRLAFKVEIKPLAVDDWLPANAELGRLPFSILITPPHLFTLNVASDPFIGGWVTVEPEKANYLAGDIVILTAVRIWPWRFSHWDMDGGYLDTVNPMSFLIMGSHKITAHFLY